MAAASTATRNVASLALFRIDRVFRDGCDHVIASRSQANPAHNACIDSFPQERRSQN
jgi:hypothetical protein